MPQEFVDEESFDTRIRASTEQGIKVGLDKFIWERRRKGGAAAGEGAFRIKARLSSPHMLSFLFLRTTHFSAFKSSVY